MQVSGAGFDPNASLASAECKNGAVSTTDCDLNTTTFVTADGTGAYAFNLIVQTILNTDNGTVDCTANDGECVIGVADTSDLTGTAVTAPISFAPHRATAVGRDARPAAPVATRPAST